MLQAEEEAHRDCGAPQERALTAVQFEQDEGAMLFRALALQEQARRIQSGEIVCVANHDVETNSCFNVAFLDREGVPNPVACVWRFAF